MFKNPRYTTKGINDNLPIMTQIFLWGLIDNMKVDEKDYLQVFTLSVEDGQQKVLHEQECPEYTAEHLFPSTDPIEGKIFVIDDETHSTMLFAEEYKGGTTMQNDIIFCDRCGCEITSDSAHHFEGDYFCSECFDEATTVCTHCGERVWSEDNAGTISMPLCERCYDNHYTSCEDCGRIIHQDYANYFDDDDYPYCDACFNLRNNGPIHDYNYKPDPEFFGEGSRYFGVELEIDKGGKLGENAEHIISVANAKAEHIYIKSDGSLNDGMEIVTHPMSLDYHRVDMPWENICDKAIHLHYQSHKTTTCGLHIHVNRTTFGETREEQDECISRVLYFVEHHWAELLKFSRRTEYTMNKWAARYGYKHDPKAILDSAKKGCNGRYACVNITNWSTIEFRMFKGTLKVNTIIATLELVNKICDLALYLTDEEIAGISWTSFVKSLNNDDHGELITYLKERQLYVNEPIEFKEDE